MKKLLPIAALSTWLAASYASAQQPPIGKLVPDMKAWRKEAATAPIDIRVNGQPIKITAKDRKQMIDWIAQLLEGLSLDIKPDETFVLTLPFGQVTGTWAMDGQRLVATPTKIDVNPIITHPTAKPFWLVREGNVIRFSYDDDHSHSVPLMTAPK